MSEEAISDGERSDPTPSPTPRGDAYLERIDDRINWRLTHVSLPVADVKYLFSTIEAEVAARKEAEEELERYEADEQGRMDRHIARLQAHATTVVVPNLLAAKDRELAAAEERLERVREAAQIALDHFAPYTNTNTGNVPGLAMVSAMEPLRHAIAALSTEGD